MIIKSLLSQDLYKYTMLNVFFQKLQGTTVRYRFKCRNEGVFQGNLLQFRNEIKEEIDALCELKHTTEELNWLAGHRFFFEPFINYLEDYTLKRRHITVGEKNGHLDIVMEGPLTGVSPFEIFVLKIVQEVYMRNVHPMNKNIEETGKRNLAQKIQYFQDFSNKESFVPVVTDFGGRRAYSTDWHEYTVGELSKHNVIIGTSDMDLARRFGIKAIGTMAHEMITTFQGLGVCPIIKSQSTAFQTWCDVYRGDLGIFISDTLGDKKFLIDFDPYFAKLADGCRHDSGDPFKWGDMIVSHYKSLNVEPMTKTLIFSDGLNFEKAFQLAIYFKDTIKVSFGIGTWLTNDLGVTPLQNVIKQIEVNGNPVAKISNDPGKTMCEDIDYLNYFQKILNNL